MKFNNVEYSVRFNIVGKKISRIQAFFGKMFGDKTKNAYIDLRSEIDRIKDSKDASEITGGLGANTGTWVWKPDTGISGHEYSHEFGHMLAWYDPTQFAYQDSRQGQHDMVGYLDTDGKRKAGIMTPTLTEKKAPGLALNNTESFDFTVCSVQPFINDNNNKDYRTCIATILRRVTQADINRIGLMFIEQDKLAPITRQTLGNRRDSAFMTRYKQNIIEYLDTH